MWEKNIFLFLYIFIIHTLNFLSKRSLDLFLKFKVLLKFFSKIKIMTIILKIVDNFEARISKFCMEVDRDCPRVSLKKYNIRNSLKIIKDCGISIDNGKDQLKASARNFPLEIFYLRNGDIPQYLKDGVVDIAIIGENVLIEKGEEITFTQRLGFSKCKVSLAISKNETYTGIDYFTNK